MKTTMIKLGLALAMTVTFGVIGTTTVQAEENKQDTMELVDNISNELNPQEMVNNALNGDTKPINNTLDKVRELIKPLNDIGSNMKDYVTTSLNDINLENVGQKVKDIYNIFGTTEEKMKQKLQDKSNDFKAKSAELKNNSVVPEALNIDLNEILSNILESLIPLVTLVVGLFQLIIGVIIGLNIYHAFKLFIALRVNTTD